MLLALFSFTRLLFYVFNFHLFSALSLGEALLHFFYGLRFDIATIFLFNVLFIVISILPQKLLNHGWLQIVNKAVFVFVNALLLGANLVDVAFFEFEGKRLTSDIFTKEWLGGDFITLLPEFIKDYWYLFLIFISITYVLVKFYPKYRAKSMVEDKRWGLPNQIVIGVVLLVVSVYASRGGVQLKPIGVITAARYTSPQYMGLILNSPFTLVKTMGNKPLDNPNYFTLDELEEVYRPVHQYNHENKNCKNVVIVILESFGKEYSGFLNDTMGYTPHFDSIMQKGLTFTQAYANGKRSIEALPSIFSSIPQLTNKAFVHTQYASNNIEGIGSILTDMGYESAFYHGGKNGTMGFDNFSQLAGIDHYYGIEQYPDENDYDGNWGVFDEPYLMYFSKQLGEMQEPFFAAIFTLSSHHPYIIPEKYEGKFSQGKLINHESIGYTDYALGEFFKQAEQQEWYKNTLFVLTADHTAQALHPFYKTNRGKYAVPIVFYAPGDTALNGISEQVCQQTDIFPSVLDYLGYSKPFVAFGNSVFSSTDSPFSISYVNGIYQLITPELTVSFNGKSIVDTTFYSNTLAKKGQMEKVNHAQKKLKAIIQQYNIRMEHNLMRYHGKLSDFFNQ